MHGIDRVEKAIIENAERKADETVSEAKRRAAEIAAKSDAEAGALERKVLGDAEKQASLARERVVADARMHVANEVVEAKNRVLDSVFVDALDALVKWKKRNASDYKKWVSRLVAGATRGKTGASGASGASGVQLVFASDDAKLFKNDYSGKFAVSFSDELIGGVIVRLPSENIEIDESFEQKIRGARGVCAVDVAKMLFGGKKNKD